MIRKPIYSKFCLSITLIALAILDLSCVKFDDLREEPEVSVLYFVTDSLFPGLPGKAYQGTIIASGGKSPYTYEIIEGSLPANLTLDSNGTISGMIDPDAEGEFPLTIKVTDDYDYTLNQAFTFVVSNDIYFITESFPYAIVDTGYAHTVEVGGGSGSYTFSASGLPIGFNLDSEMGILSGSSSVGSQSTITITARDDKGLIKSKSYSFYVTSVPKITTTSLPFSAAGQSYSSQLECEGDLSPITFSVTNGSLPDGLSLSPSGLISGIPEFGKNIRLSPMGVTIQIKDSINQTSTKALTLQVFLQPKLLDDAVAPLRPAREGLLYLDYLTVLNGKGAITFSCQGLPAGLTCDSNSGFIRGTATSGQAGNHTLIITATDENGFISQINKNLTVVSSGLQSVSFGAPLLTSIGYYNGTWSYGYDIDTADLNNDGIMDVVWPAYDPRGIIVLLGKGDGSFNKYFIDSHSATRPHRIKIADVTGDDIPDIITSSANEDVDGDGTTDTFGYIDIYKGDNDWTNPSAILKQSTHMLSTTLAFDVKDINFDNRPDIVVSTWNYNTLKVLMNCGPDGTSIIYEGSTVDCSHQGQAVTNLHFGSNISNPYHPRDVKIADIDQDGDQDLITLSYYSHYIYVIKNNGDGTFASKQTTSLGVNHPRKLILADVTGEGWLDAIVVSNNDLTILHGDGNGGWLNKESFNFSDLGGTAEHFDIGDIDGDGDLDVVIGLAGVHSNNVIIYYNQGGGTFGARRTLSVGYQSHGIRLAKILSDSPRDDLVLSVGAWVRLARLAVFPNNGQVSAFETGDTYKVNPPNNETAIYGAPLVIDANEDGHPDILSKIGGALSMLISNGDGTFTLSNDVIPTGDTSANWWFGRQLIANDFNGDGHMDIATANWNGGGSGTVSVLLGNGDGTFISSHTFAPNQSGCQSNSGTRSIDSGDIDQNGTIDLIVATGCGTSPGSQVYIYNGNGDGTFNTGNPSILPGSGAYADHVMARDLNADGLLDVIIGNNDSWITLYRGTGKGNFATPVKADLVIANNISQMDVGDLNKDGLLDIIATTVSGPNIAVVIMGPNFTISSAQTISGLGGDYAGQRHSGAQLVDWDRDGHLDLVAIRTFMYWVATNGGGGIHFFKGNGNGSFTVKSTPFNQANFAPYSEGLITIHDLNDDGLPDVINGSSYSSSGSGLGINWNKSH